VTHTLRSQHNTNALRWAQACGKHSKRSRKSNIAFGKGKHGKHKHNNSSLKLVHEPAFIPEQIAAALKPNAVAPGLVHKSYKNRITVNLLDIDTMRAPIHIRPIMASESFGDLKDVSDAAKASRAVAAVNANYFKKDGTPLGTLIVDGEWVSGPLYDRVALGIDNAGLMHIDKVQLGGILETSNTDAPQIWINNVNQPRRNGAHVVAYTRRWGCNVRMDYPGCLVALNAQGEVVGKDTRTSYIPIGGIVLTDSKDSAIAKLKVGDLTHLTWQTRPDSWQDVSQAVSGGPLLIKDDKVFLDLKAEKFHPSWTGNQIKARTACGVTADNHLLLITVEGSHTLWDLAKLLHCLGAVDAMNLDGGGSTTMVVNNVAVTRGAKSHERRVASAIGIFLDQSTGTAHSWACSYSPKDDLADLVKSSIDPAMQEQISTALIGAPSLAQISADDLDDSQPDFLSGAATASQPDLSPQPLQAN
jgi:exopolysaccharide biosynthesis protein